ncbi:MAG TPA: vitamin K epoxide reductase family protein [Anaerolineae bacterium]|nr:vitamin K epoxide reductase family protein [Anaerolineae bacterium]
MRKSLLSLVLLCMMVVFAPLAAAQTAEEPVVRAVLFYSPTCPHCHTVINETLLPMMEQYGERLQVIGIDITQPSGAVLYEASTEQFDVPAEMQGVPRLVVGDRFMVGSLQIPQEFPGIVEQGLASGGIDWPAIPGLAEALAAGQQAEEAAETPSPAVESEAETSAATATPALAATPTPEVVAISTETMPPTDSSAAPTGMPDGGWLAVALLGGMLLALLYAVVRIWPARQGLFQSGQPLAAAVSSPLVPLLAVLGLGVAGYMAYVEITHVAAVCGPVGECNAVQTSQYATVAGIPVAVLGLINFAAVGVLWLMQRSGAGRWARPAALALLGLAVFGVLFSIYLTLLELFVIHAICMWCLSSALITTLIMLVVVAQLTRGAAVEGAAQRRQAAAV